MSKEKETKQRTLLIDPPEGWRYGFPKRMPYKGGELVFEDVAKWLVENGYPQVEIDRYGGRFYYQVSGEVDR